MPDFAVDEIVYLWRFAARLETSCESILVQEIAYESAQCVVDCHRVGWL